MKLLIVDDSALVRRSIEAAYSKQKFTEIRTAADGLLAVSIYKEFEPDVVTLDITMPYMDGLAALTEMLEYNTNSKILVISALADHHTAIEALKRGADQFICKPFSDEDLREALDDLVLEQISSSSPTTVSAEQTQKRTILERAQQNTGRLKTQPTLVQPTNQPIAPTPQQYPSGYVAPPNPHSAPAIAPPPPPPLAPQTGPTQLNSHSLTKPSA